MIIAAVCLRVFSILGLLVLLVLAWGLVNGMFIMMNNLKEQKATANG